MATATWENIASYTLPSSAATVTFNSIPNLYKNICIYYDGESTVENQISMQVNGTAGGYSWVQLGADPGSGIFTGSVLSQSTLRVGYASTGRNMFKCNIFNANQSLATQPETLSFATKAGSADIRLIGGRYANAQVISSIKFLQDGGSFQAGSKFQIWGMN